MAYIEKRKGRDGKPTHRAMIRLKGYPTQTATFERLTDAKNWVQQTEAAMREGRYFKSAASKKHTVADMITRYLTQLSKDSAKRHKDVCGKLQWWKDELGYALLADLTKATINEKIEILSARTYTLNSGKVKRITPATVNRYITAFSHVCTVAVNEWEWLEQHPLQKISKKKEPRGRVRFLNDDERAALLEVCKTSESKFLYSIVVLALSTGARRGEIMNLKWQDVDFERRVITLHITKNGDRRILPLAGKALEEITALHQKRDTVSDYIFPSPYNPRRPWNIQGAWNTAVTKAKLQDFRFHDLRHSAASYLAMNGASLAEIAEVLGHKTLQMVKRYAHLSEAHTSAVVAKMNERIFS
jgi:integrase